MPVYKYQCDKCGHLSERNLPISQRKDCVGQDCSINGCDGIIAITIGAPQTVGGVKDAQDIPEGFKDVLREIKKGAGKDCDIDV